MDNDNFNNLLRHRYVVLCLIGTGILNRISINVLLFTIFEKKKKKSRRIVLIDLIERLSSALCEVKSDRMPKRRRKRNVFLQFIAHHSPATTNSLAIEIRYYTHYALFITITFILNIILSRTSYLLCDILTIM